MAKATLAYEHDYSAVRKMLAENAAGKRDFYSIANPMVIGWVDSTLKSELSSDTEKVARVRGALDALRDMTNERIESNAYTAREMWGDRN